MLADGFAMVRRLMIFLHDGAHDGGQDGAHEGAHDGGHDGADMMVVIIFNACHSFSRKNDASTARECGRGSLRTFALYQ